jgi:tetratricopeptide (TPR) repeat protein
VAVGVVVGVLVDVAVLVVFLDFQGLMKAPPGQTCRAEVCLPRARRCLPDSPGASPRRHSLRRDGAAIARARSLQKIAILSYWGSVHDERIQSARQPTTWWSRRRVVMPSQPAPRNPYIAGKALSDERGFFGREDVFRVVHDTLASQDQNAIVLFGQRRIGKTSILRQLRRRLPSPPIYTVYFDLMDQARKPLGSVLYELAATVAAEVGLPALREADFLPAGDYFHEQFLPSLYQRLGADIRPVFLFDEFDVLDVAAEEKLDPTAAARTFFPYLRRLMESQPRLAFVFVVGRKVEDLAHDFMAAFKGAHHKRISVLDDESARQLVGLAEREGSLHFDVAAVDHLLSLTARHPLYTQLMCQLLFDRAYAAAPSATPTIDVADVEAVIPRMLEAGEHFFEWVWGGLPPAERVIFSGIAGATIEKAVITEDELAAILHRHGIRILIRELELAPKTLVEWEMLRQIDGGYSFFIEIMRRWVAERKPLPKVKDELDRVNPIADQQYQLGHSYYSIKDLRRAVSQLQDALQVNPNHLKARLLLGEALREQGAVDAAVQQLEEAYRYDSDAARYPLVRALLARGEELERGANEDEALGTYAHVLEISNNESVARERRQGILLARGDKALQANEFLAAITAYGEAGAEQKVVAALALQRKHALEQSTTEIEPLLEREQWDKAAEVYQRLNELDPEDPSWREGLQRVEQERLVAQRYAEGLGVMQQHKWQDAQRAFVEVVGVRPDYKEAAAQLAIATRELKAERELTKVQKARTTRATFKWSRGPNLCVWWAMTSAIGWALADALPAILPAGFTSDWKQLTSGAIAGTIAGVMQWLVLRHHMISGGKWVVGSVIGWAPALALGDIAGLTIGVAQWNALRRRVPHSGYWILASVAGWTLAIKVAAISSGIGLFFSAVAGMTYGLVTGVILLWLLGLGRTLFGEPQG